MVIIYLESWYVGACRALPGQILFSNYIMWPQSEMINELPWTRRLQTSPSRCYPCPFQKAVNFWMIYSGAVRLFIFGCNYFATKSCCYIKYCIYPSVVTCKYCIYPSVVTCFQQFSELPILVIVSQRMTLFASLCWNNFTLPQFLIPHSLLCFDHNNLLWVRKYPW